MFLYMLKLPKTLIIRLPERATRTSPQTEYETRAPGVMTSDELTTPSDLGAQLVQLTRMVSDSNPTHSSGDCNVESPEFCGPSSSEYTLNVVNKNLQARGMPAPILDRSGFGIGGMPSLPFRLANCGPFTKLLTADPLWDFKLEDTMNSINTWCDGVGALYPVVERVQMMRTAEHVFATLASARRDGPKMNKGVVAEVLFNVETNKLKMILAIGRTLRQGGRSNEAHRLFQSISEAVEGLIWHSDGLGGIQLLTLAVSILLCHL